MGMTWLITGGCGFIGTNLTKRLLSEGGHYIRILDNLSSGTCNDLAQVADFKKIKTSELGYNVDQVDLLVGDILMNHFHLKHQMVLMLLFILLPILELVLQLKILVWLTSNVLAHLIC